MIYMVIGMVDKDGKVDLLGDDIKMEGKLIIIMGDIDDMKVFDGIFEKKEMSNLDDDGIVSG